LGAVAGCELVPPNNFRILTTEPAGTHPVLIHLRRGTFCQAGENGVALMDSPTAMLLFDWSGSANRVQLLFRQGADVASYERIGQWPWLRGTAGRVARPQGVHAEVRANQQLRGSLDVFLARSEDRDVDTAFEHFPRAIRVVGYFVIPGLAADPDTHPVAPFLPPTAEDPNHRPPRLIGFGGDEHEHAFAELDQRLPALPLIDVAYLVPSSLADAFRPIMP
jgi:hypothetical protein